MLGAIQKLYSKKYGFPRTVNELRCFWSRIWRECTYYIDTKALIEKHLPISHKMEESADSAMIICTRHAGKWMKNVYKPVT